MASAVPKTVLSFYNLVLDGVLKHLQAPGQMHSRLGSDPRQATQFANTDKT